MRARTRLLTSLTGSVLILAACGSGAGEETSPAVAASPSSTTTLAQTNDTQSATSTEAEPATTSAPAANQDLSSVDWATVDLTTIDWANIDMSQVDWSAISDNPTATNLDKATIDLIQSSLDPGNATLTVGDETFEFDNFLCAFGHDATESDVYAFSSNSFGEYQGTRVQMQANIRDEAGQGRFEGPDLTHEVFVQDVEDFENPAVDIEMFAPEGITIDGDTVTAEGTFENKLTSEQLSGSLQATCGDQSRR
ncbi:MAG: hypothetical protein WB239_14710 [Acidimicrobiia bacterium]